MTEQKGENADIELLTRLGFGLKSRLMSDSRVLVDAHFQGILFHELNEKLGGELAGNVRAQIGLYHGLREGLAALGSAQTDLPHDAPPAPACPTVPIRLRGCGKRSEFEIRGTWCDTAEARAEASRGTASPQCTLTSGYASGWLSGLFGREIAAFEVACENTGAERCHFVARNANAWQSEGHSEKCAFIDALPFELFRRSLESLPADLDLPSETTEVPAASAAQVWGPVMILPVHEPSEALRNVQAIASRRDYEDIRAVVINFPQEKACFPSILGPIETILNLVTSWGAEPVLANVPATLGPALQKRALGPYLIRPNLNEAVASAFQIVDAQKHLL